MKRYLDNKKLIKSKKSPFFSLLSWVRLIVILIISISFILNNLDILGIKVNNPIKWMSVSYFFNSFREPIQKELKISEEKVKQGKYKIILKIDDNLSYIEKEKKIGVLLNSMVINKKIPNEQLIIDRKNCSKVIEDTIRKIGLKEFSCEVEVITVKNIAYRYNNEYYNKDVRLDNIIMKRLDFIIKETPDYEDSVSTEINNNIPTIKLKENIKDNEKQNIIIKKNWELYMNKYPQNQMVTELCPKDLIDLLTLYVSFECRLLTFKINNSLVKENNRNKIYNIDVSDIILYDFKLKM